ncbi:MAG: integral membrane protein MviN, virulence factor [Candidatus Peregrinibacteria bacterium GW2011_GWF2_38_29]|nr:MAG: integral membrane protein MviN, virulence factor [Candidatus Peregrinibacteria bacterium GW2011_GWF2_38_29]HBB02964.1 murein biosynthesis integral membrane protein MurJ [Candidatus Peregrinibacteria bacterium]
MTLKQKLLSGAVLLGVSSLLSRLLGLLRDRLFATTFGAVTADGIHNLDTYYAAFRLPDMLFQLLLYGVISASFIPIFSAYIKKDKAEEGWAFANSCTTILTTFLFGVVALSLIFAPWLVKLIVPGFSQEKLDLTVNLTRIMLISPLFFGFSSIWQSIQNSFGKYFYIALAPVVYNLSIILATIIGAKEYGVYAITVGVVIGAFLHAGVQLPEIIRLGFKFMPNWNWRRGDLKEMGKLIIPRIVGLSAIQINLVVDTIIGSTLATGSITVLNYAINLNSLPMGIIGISISIVAFGVFAELAALEEHKKFFDHLKENFYKIIYLIIPAAVGMIILKKEIVGVILSGGKFGEQDIVLTAGTLGILSIGLAAQSINPLLSRAYFAYKNTKTPVLISIFSVVLNIVFSITLTKIFDFGVYGLATATSAAGLIQWFLLQAFLKTKLPHKQGKILEFGKIAKIIIATTVMAAIVFAAKNLITNFISPGFILSAVQVAVCGLLGLLIYFSSLKILKYKNCP